MDTATAIALGSLAVAALGFGYSIKRDRDGARALQVEREERRAALAREEGRRDEELRLLRLQVELRDDEVVSAKTAALIGKNTGYSGSSIGVAFPIHVRNVGRAVAHDVRVWLALASPDGTVGASLTAAHDLGALVPNDPPVTFNLVQAAVKAGADAPHDGLIVAAWMDEAVQREKETIGRLTVFL